MDDNLLNFFSKNVTIPKILSNDTFTQSEIGVKDMVQISVNENEFDEFNPNKDEKLNDL